MIILEVLVGDKFVINETGYRKLVFEVVDKNERGVIAELDMEGLPRLQREFFNSLEVLRVWDVEPLS